MNISAIEAQDKEIKRLKKINARLLDACEKALIKERILPGTWKSSDLIGTLVDAITGGQS